MKNIGYKVPYKICDKLYNEVEDKVWYKIYNKVWDKVEDKIWYKDLYEENIKLK